MNEQETFEQRKSRLEKRYKTRGKGRPHYLKDIEYTLTEFDGKEMFENCKQPKEQFLFAVLYLTGARPIEVSKLRVRDFNFDNEEYITIRMFTAKLTKPNVKGFVLRYRMLQINRKSLFIDVVENYVKQFNDSNKLLIPVSSVRIRQVVYKISKNRFCPYHFRHSRLTKLAWEGADPLFLKYWKGSKTLQSIEGYLRGRPVGKQYVLT